MNLGGALILLNLLSAAGAFGQVHPFDMDAGVRSWVGPGTISVVGGGARWFILTDIVFTAQFPAGSSEFVLQIEGANSGQQTYMVQQVNLPVDSAFQTVPLSFHWTTGIAFPPGDEMRVRVDNIPSNTAWFVNYSGYLVEPPPGAVGGQSPTVAPSHLGQNVPNPFNPTTQITYNLASAEDIKLRFYDSQGRMVRTLIDGRNEAGEHSVTWDGKDDSGQSLPSGVYYYELGGVARTESRKAILLK
jgi:hypothetical protein